MSDKEIEKDNWTFIPWTEPQCMCYGFIFLGKCEHIKDKEENN